MQYNQTNLPLQRVGSKIAIPQMQTTEPQNPNLKPDPNIGNFLKWAFKKGPYALSNGIRIRHYKIDLRIAVLDNTPL